MPITAINRTVVLLLTNKSGGNRNFGDVVIITSTDPNAFATTTTAGYIDGQVGVVLEPNGILADAIGSVAMAGYCPQINLDTAATVGQLLRTHTVATQATPHDPPFLSGDFGQALSASATPEAYLFGSVNAGIVPDPGWAVTNYTPRRTIDASAYTIEQVIDLVCTLIDAHIAQGILEP